MDLSIANAIKINKLKERIESLENKVDGLWSIIDRLNKNDILCHGVIGEQNCTINYDPNNNGISK